MEPPITRTRMIAVASGKGGVGKTVVTANLALGLAQQLGEMDSPVVAVDLDLGCGNLNACLGVRSPSGTVNGFLKGRTAHLSQVLSPTQQANLKMICSSYSGQAEMQLPEHLKRALLEGLRQLEASFVLMDLGAGTSADVLDLFLGADERLMVITPEALSLHNAFVFLKTALLRLIGRELVEGTLPGGIRELWEAMASEPEHFNLRSAVEQIRAHDRMGGYLLQGLISQLEVRLVVNRYRGGAERSYLINFYRLLAKYLGTGDGISCLGFVHFDSGIPKSVQGLRPFLLGYPGNPAAGDIRELARGISAVDSFDRHCFQFPDELAVVSDPAVPAPNGAGRGDGRNGPRNAAPNGRQLVPFPPDAPAGAAFPTIPPPPGDLPEVVLTPGRPVNGSTSEDILEVARLLPLLP